jgi:hypothetical protein
MKHIIWNKSKEQPTRTHDTYEEALIEARRLVSRQPNDIFHIYEEVAVVRATVNIEVEPAKKTSPVKDDIPPSYVYLGVGGSFKTPQGMCGGSYGLHRQIGNSSWLPAWNITGASLMHEYCAARDSELAKINGK